MIWIACGYALACRMPGGCHDHFDGLQSVEQVAFADVILLNKNDLVSVGGRKRIAARIKVQIC